MALNCCVDTCSPCSGDINLLDCDSQVSVMRGGVGSLNRERLDDKPYNLLKRTVTYRDSEGYVPDYFEVEGIVFKTVSSSHAHCIMVLKGVRAQLDLCDSLLCDIYEFKCSDRCDVPDVRRLVQEDVPVVIWHEESKRVIRDLISSFEGEYVLVFGQRQMLDHLNYVLVDDVVFKVKEVQGDNDPTQLQCVIATVSQWNIA